MEGTVTISLEDYEKLKRVKEELKRVKEEKKHYFNMVDKQIELLEAVENYLISTGTPHIIRERVEKYLNDWYC